MRRWAHDIFLVVWLSAAAVGGAAALAQPSSRISTTDTTRTDTTKPVVLPEVVVEAESIIARVASSSQPLSIITRSQVQASNARDASDAVAFSPGVFVRQYGGLGGLRTISLRGTSARQSVVLIDGVRYQSSTSDGVDLGNISADALERIEVVRGSNAAQFGANALGGVINLISRAGTDSGFGGQASASVGSFSERHLDVDLGTSSAGHRVDAALHFANTDGDYPFDFNEFGVTSTVHRQNADFANVNGRLAWSYRGDNGVRISTAVQGFNAERGVPGAIVQGSREQLHARLDERELFSVARVALSRSEWSASVALSGRLNRLEYRDPDTHINSSEGINNRWDRSEGACDIRVRRMISDNGILEASGEVSYASVRGDNLDPSVGNAVDRVQVGGAVSNSWMFEQALSWLDISVDGGVRGDYFSDVNAAISPSLGIVLHPVSTPLRVRVFGALGYRAPSFTEQYYLNFGNTNLRPERSRSVDVGATYEITEAIVVESSLFLIDTRDQIVAVPRSPVTWSAGNIGRALSRGLELSFVGSLFDRLLDVRASYTLMRTEDRSGGVFDEKLLVYSPQELFNGIVQLRLGDYTVGTTWQYVSHRHTLPLNPADAALPAYTLIGANATGQWNVVGINLMLRLEATNLFDVDYQVIKNYPMPGRAVRVGIEFRI